MAQSPKRRANLLGARIRAWFEGRTSGTGSDAAPGPGEDLERELRRTQAQLVEARAEITALRRQKGDLRPALARVLKKRTRNFWHTDTAPSSPRKIPASGRP